MIAEIVAPVASLAGVAQSQAAAELAARSPRKQAYAEFIQAVHELVRELEDLLPGPDEQVDQILYGGDLDEYGPHAGQVKRVCEKHLRGIGTAHAVIRLEGPQEAFEAASNVCKAVDVLWSGAVEVGLSGDGTAYRHGFTSTVGTALSEFAGTCSGVLNRSI